MIAERGDIYVILSRQLQYGHAGTTGDLGTVQSYLYLHAGSLFWESSPCSAIQEFSLGWWARQHLKTQRTQPVRALWKEQPGAPPTKLPLCRYSASPCRDVGWPELAASRVLGSWPKDVLSRWAFVSTAQWVGRVAGSPGWAWKPPDDAVFFLDGGF